MIAIDGRGEGGADIPEAGLAVAIAALLGNHLQHPVAIGRTSAQEERGMVGDDGYFEGGLAGDESDAGRPMKLPPVGSAVVDVHDRGYTSAILRGDATLVELGFAHHVAIEGREDAEHVHRIEDGVAVEQDEILVGGTASYIEAARRFAHGLDTRECLHHLHHVGFAQCQGDVAKLCRTEFLHAHLGVVDLLHETLNSYLVEDVVFANGFEIGEDVRFEIGFLFLIFGFIVTTIGVECLDVYWFVREDGIGSLAPSESARSWKTRKVRRVLKREERGACEQLIQIGHIFAQAFLEVLVVVFVLQLAAIAAQRLLELGICLDEGLDILELERFRIGRVQEIVVVGY